MRLLSSELRLRRNSLLVWTVSVGALVALVVAFYPQVRNDTSLNNLYAGLSPSLQALLGGSDLTSPVGYLNTQLFAFFLPAVVLIFGLGRGVGSIGGEEEERTLDLLLAQPVARWSAYLQKSAAIVVGVGSLGLSSFFVLLALDSVAKVDLPAANTAAVCLQMLLFSLALSLAAQAISAATGRRAYGLAVVAGYTLVSYVVYGLSATVSWLAPLRPLSLWRWYLYDEPLATGFNWVAIAVLGTVCLASSGLGVFFFSRRDLNG